MEAIDFKKILREERKRSKQKRIDSSKHDGATTPDVNLAPPSAKLIAASLSSTKASDEPNRSESDLERVMSSLLHVNDSNQHVVAEYTKPINFEKLRLGERRRIKQPAWSYAPGFLSLSHLALASICEDPESISYSRTALATDRRDPDDAGNGGEGSIIATNALEDWLRRLPSGESGLCEWKTMSFGKRRVCMFGEEDGDGGGGSLPSPLQEIADELVSVGVFPSKTPPNHVLLNEYQAGQGILPHTDGPLYDSRTATLSLSSCVVIEFTKRLSSSEIGNTHGVVSAPTSSLERDGIDAAGSNPLLHTSIASPVQVLLEPGSLLVFQDEAYLNYCHGIATDVWHDETTERCLNAPPHQIVPRGKRYSITFRHKKNA